MGFFDGIKTALRVQERVANIALETPRRGKSAVISPWAEGQLQKVVWSQILETSPEHITRAEAITLPAVASNRARIIDEIAHLPLRQVRNGELTDPQPAWLSNTKTGVPPYFRMVDTLDDLIFYGQSLWVLRREEDTKRIIDAARVPYDRWSISEADEILIDDEPVEAGAVIYFRSAFEGLLNTASRTIRGGIEIEETWVARAKVPLPQIILQEREGSDLEQHEADEYVADIAAARRDPNGSVMFVPASIEAKVEGSIQTDVMTEARNQTKLDIASFLNIPSSAVDAALPKASLNYETEKSNQEELKNRLTYWTAPIEARLSMDDITPEGTIIAFDFSDNSNRPGGSTGPYRED